MIDCYALAQHREMPYRMGYDLNGKREFITFEPRKGLPQDQLPDDAIPSLARLLSLGTLSEAKLREDGKVIYPDSPAYKAAAPVAEEPRGKRSRR